MAGMPTLIRRLLLAAAFALGLAACATSTTTTAPATASADRGAALAPLDPQPAVAALRPGLQML